MKFELYIFSAVGEKIFHPLHRNSISYDFPHGNIPAFFCHWIFTQSERFLAHSASALQILEVRIDPVFSHWWLRGCYSYIDSKQAMVTARFDFRKCLSVIHCFISLSGRLLWSVMKTVCMGIQNKAWSRAVFTDLFSNLMIIWGEKVLSAGNKQSFQ